MLPTKSRAPSLVGIRIRVRIPFSGLYVGTRTRPNSVLKKHSCGSESLVPWSLHIDCAAFALIYATKSLVRVVYEIHINHRQKMAKRHGRTDQRQRKIGL